jgi:hypothetical protein
MLAPRSQKLLDRYRRGGAGPGRVPTRAVFQSLNRIVCTEGKERTLGKYDALLRGAGWKAGAPTARWAPCWQ